MLSLNSRLLIAASVVLVGFLGLTGVALDQAFRDSAETALKDRLLGYVYTLLAAADLQADVMLHLPQDLPEGRFSQAGSGLYAQILSNDGRQYWQSPSMLGVDLPRPGPLPPGARVFSPGTRPDGMTYYGLRFGVTYLGEGKAQRNYTFSVTESLDSLRAQVSRFRRSLWAWLGAAGLVLLAVQGSILRWSLAPVRHAEKDLMAIERGERAELGGLYPRELLGLTENLNALLRNDRARVERYRQALADLAHSLKTPLAVLWGALDGSSPCGELVPVLHEQVERMTQIVDYQLQRAAASGRTTLTAPVAVAAAASQVVQSLNKVYADKGVACELQIEPGAAFYGEEGDLFEVMGNLLDNAYQWCTHRVAMGARPVAADTAGHRPGLSLWVEDDGPGIPPATVLEILERGRRAEASAGHGIGLRIVQDIVRLYGGTLQIRASATGGTRVEACFTQASQAA
jgi:two-component system, OmpR family, sensor histidine kinase PhoQ